MEGMKAAGKTRSIGVSNFTTEQLDHLITESNIAPAVNQIELHPYFPQQDMVAFCAAKGIKVMGYSPLGSSSDRAPPQHNCTLLVLSLLSLSLLLLSLLSSCLLSCPASTCLLNQYSDSLTAD
jgi:diketogulonate reductase-like aldo/keto reductase